MLYLKQMLPSYRAIVECSTCKHEFQVNAFKQENLLLENNEICGICCPKCKESLLLETKESENDKE